MLHLDKGIFLEDKKVLLEWGQSVKKLAADNNAKVIRTGDRTIVEWGTHTICNGLTLELSNVYLLTTGPLNFTIFKSIGHQTNGDKISMDSFDLISKHFLNQIGEPTEKHGTIEQEREKCWVWQTRKVKITLYLFEQHAFKLHLTIAKN